MKKFTFLKKRTYMINNIIYLVRCISVAHQGHNFDLKNDFNITYVNYNAI